MGQVLPIQDNAKNFTIAREASCLCGRMLFDGAEIRSRRLRVEGNRLWARCRCKRWTRL